MGAKNREKGASAVEFAIVLPVLIVILFGIIEFGLILYDKAVITNASREGARRGIVYHEPGTITSSGVAADIVNTVNIYTANYLISFGSVPAVPLTTVSGDCFSPGTALSVTVTYPYTFLVLPDFVSTLGGGITLNASTVMNCENQGP
jgi:Flp pilus assembly protein TadG